MRKKYEDFIQLKPKDMSKAMSDMTYKFINPDTNQPTMVPPAHFEKILSEVQEIFMADVTSRQFLTIMYNQLNALYKEDPKYFYQALICMDMGLNPKDLRIPEQIALTYTHSYMEDMSKELKKEFHFLSEDITEKYKEIKENPDFQREAIKMSDRILEDENSFNHKTDHREER